MLPVKPNTSLAKECSYVLHSYWPVGALIFAQLAAQAFFVCGFFGVTEASRRLQSQQPTYFMPYNRISAQDKQRLVNAFTRNEDYQELASTLGIKRTTAWAIVKRATADGGQVERPRGGFRPENQKLTPYMRALCVGIVEEHADFTLDQINAELRLRAPDQRQVSISTIARALQGELIVTKKLEDAPAERNNEAVKDRRQDFAQWIMNAAVNTEMIFIDEAGINIWTKRSYGRAHRGERAVRVVAGRRGNNLTITFAISATNGVVFHDIKEGGMTGETFVNFIEAVVNAFPHDGLPRALIFDNAPAHRRAGNADLPQNVSLHWLPPYSPFLNIAEKSISQWKAAMKRDLAAVRDQVLREPNNQRVGILAQLCEQNARITTPGNAQGYFRHLQAYLPNCLLRNDIFM